MRFGGFIRPRGEFHGLVVTHTEAGRTGTSHDGRALLNLEHYAASSGPGRFVPRREASQTARLDARGRVEILFGSTERWPVEASVRYELSGDDAVDAVFRFRFKRPFAAFEAFVASYFQPGTSPPWIRLHGTWLQPEIRLEEQLFVPRDDASAAIANDGRWAALHAEDRTYRVTPERFDAALMVAGYPGDICVLQMIDPTSCSQLAPNTFVSAHDIALIGKDVAAGDDLSVRVRLVVCRLADLSAAVTRYETFLAELSSRQDD